MRTLLPLGAAGLAILVLPVPVMGQSLIVPDDTLGAERSQVNTVGNIERITGGARRSQNLFHSFEEFNVSEGRGAFFESPVGLENIFGRVTGSNPSNISGTLGTSGDSSPNLYLMNPNGIVFGPNSRLDVQGSLIATTAEGIRFGEQGSFSATVPEVPAELLTVDPSAFLFGEQAGNIVNQSEVARGLQVKNGENLLLVGGDVRVQGDLSAFGGRIDIGAVNSAGIVSLESNGTLRFPEQIERGEVVFTNGALVNVALDTNGDIAVTAENIHILSESVLAAGIEVDSNRTQR